jgi:hypothetical protein
MVEGVEDVYVAEMELVVIQYYHSSYYHQYFRQN